MNVRISLRSFLILTSLRVSTDPGWRNDPKNRQHLEWHPSSSPTTGRHRSTLRYATQNVSLVSDQNGFVLSSSDDEAILQSSERLQARLIGTGHLSSQATPSCLTFVYRVTGNPSNKLTVSVDEQPRWGSRRTEGQRYEDAARSFVSQSALAPSHRSSWTQVQVNVFSSSADSSRKATLIAFDGELTNKAQIELANISIAHQSCPPGTRNLSFAVLITFICSFQYRSQSTRNLLRKVNSCTPRH